MKANKKRPVWDDGRTIANMEVDGMPWQAKKRKQKNAENGGEGERIYPSEQLHPPTRREMFGMTLSGVLAALLIAAVFIAGAALFILFCTNLWLK